MNRAITFQASKNLRRVILAIAVALPAAAQAERLPWNDPPFTWSPQGALNAVKALRERPAPNAQDGDDSGIPIDVLLRDTRYTFDADGRMSEVAHLVYWARTDAGANYWSNVEVSWSPSREARPLIRARVITAEGEVHLLDMKTVSESAGDQDEHNTEMFTDVRTLRAPLPAMSAGVVVEEEYTTRELEPAFAAGVVNRYVFETGLPASRHTRVQVDAPESLPLHHEIFGKGLIAHANVANGHRTLSVDIDLAHMPDDETEAGQPHDAPPAPQLAFSTGKSWTDLATAYSAVVDERVSASPVADRAREWAGDAHDRREIAARLLAGLHRSVRYTALELGPNALLPHSPADVLEHKYGDCKDMSTLLVAMLRSLKVPARVALLRTAWDEVIPTLPGITAFTHAIVYVPGPDPIWIDPTDSDLPVGELPVPDQGRLALIAGPHTHALTPTPTAQVSANTEIITRRFDLAPEGASHVVQSVIATGSSAEEYRGGLRAHDARTLRHRYADYVRDLFQSPSLTRLDMNGVDAVDQPFRIEAELTGARRGFTDEKEAFVELDPGVALADLPAAFKPQEKQDESPRRRDYILPMPYEFVLRYQIFPPPGYVFHPAPEKALPHLGPFGFDRRINVGEGGMVEVDYQLVAGKRRLTPAEVAQVRAGAEEVGREGFRISFDHKGWALARDGRTREAIAQYRDLIAAHPKESLYHSQLARVLLEATAGDAAREEAQKATDLEPKSLFAWHRLGYVLEHDRVGRLHRLGFDRAGAINAYRRAIELSPRNEPSHHNLADLLALNDQGVALGPGADLTAAEKEYRFLHQELKKEDRDDQWVDCLFALGRFQEIVDVASSLQNTVGVYSKVLAARALVEGAPAAIANAQQHVNDEEQRRSVLNYASSELLEHRAYPEASALLTESLRGAPPNGDARRRADLYATTRRFESFPMDEKDPAAPVWRLLGIELGFDEDNLDLYHVFATHGDETPEQMLTDLGDGGGRWTKADLTSETMLDLLRSHGVLKREGTDAIGYRISLTLSTPSGLERPYRHYVTREDDGYRLYATEETPDRIGDKALSLAEHDQLDAARQWLDWAMDIPSVAKDPLVGAHWSPTAPRDLPAIRATAALLMARGQRPRNVLPTLEELRKKETDREVARQIGLEVAYAHLRNQDYEQTLDIVQSLAPPDHVPDELFALRDEALHSLKRDAERRTFAERRLRENPHDETALQVLVSVATEAGEFDVAEKAERQAIAQGDERTPSYYNELAWTALCRGSVTNEAIEDAQKSVSMTDAQRSRERWRASEHTLASLYAEVGRLAEARDALLGAIDASGGDLEGDDWYVFGRLYEQYGLKQDAIAAYGRVSMDDVKMPVSTAYLTRRRLDAMLGPTKAP